MVAKNKIIGKSAELLMELNEMTGGNVGLILLMRERGGMMVSPMLPHDMVIPAVGSLEQTVGEMKRKIMDGSYFQEVAQYVNAGDISEDMIDKLLKDSEVEANAHTQSNALYRRYHDEINKHLQIDEVVGNLEDKETRTAMLEGLIKLVVLKTPNWRYLVMDGKLQEARKFIIESYSDMKAVCALGNSEGILPDFSDGEMIAMIEEIESKSKLFRL